MKDTDEALVDWRSDFNRRFSVFDPNVGNPVIGGFISGKIVGQDFIRHISTKEVGDYVEVLLSRARADERKKYEGADVEGLVKEFWEKERRIPARHTRDLLLSLLTRAHASGLAAGCKEERENVKKDLEALSQHRYSDKKRHDVILWMYVRQFINNLSNPHQQ